VDGIYLCFQAILNRRRNRKNLWMKTEGKDGEGLREGDKKTEIGKKQMQICLPMIYSIYSMYLRARLNQYVPAFCLESSSLDRTALDFTISLS